MSVPTIAPAVTTEGAAQPLPITRSEVVAAFKRAVGALHGPGFTMAEACVLDPPAAPPSGCFNNANTLVEEAAEIEMTTCTGSLFITVNPIAYRAGMGRGRITRASRTKDSDVTRLRNWFVDFDPERDTDTAATDAEKEYARVQMAAARAHFDGLGFSAPIVADSGNGYHLHFLVDLPNDDQSRQLLKNATAQASALFSTAEVKVDVSVANPARLTRLYGGVNRKGTPTPERPWRRTALLEVPAERVPLTVDQLTSFIQSGTTSTAGAH